MKYFYSICIVFFGFISIKAQDLISAQLLGTRTKQEITAQYALPFIRNGAKIYKVRYTSPDAKGNKDTLSGLMVVPDDLNQVYPRIFYEHGTSDCKTCVPSRFNVAGGEEGQVGVLIAGLGFFALLPDYVGMGDGRGFQTYVHAATIVSASRNMLTACEKWAGNNGVFLNDQLFITGYSQGGYGSMALHKSIEENPGPLKVTAAAHLSGPYSLSGVMRDVILSTSVYNYPAYIPNTILGFNEVYGSLFNNVNDIFKPEYAPDIAECHIGNITLGTLNSRLIQNLTSNTGSSVGIRMIKDSVVNVIKTNLNHPLNQILKENDLYRWAPVSPTRIFYCTADDQVPFMNSVVARDSMTARGAINLLTADVGPSFNHGACITPAFTQTVFFFFAYQKVTSDVTAEEVFRNVKVYPNPATDQIQLTGLDGKDETIYLFNTSGQEIIRQKNTSNTTIQMNISTLDNGLYYVLIQSPSGSIASYRIIKM